MTDNWDKLKKWYEQPPLGLSRSKIIVKLIAEGDRLKFKAKQLKNAEIAIHGLNDEVVEIRDKLEATKNAFQIHYSVLHDCAWMDSKKMLKALDETADEMKKILEDQTSEVKAQ